jgi:hypothetical protein
VNLALVCLAVIPAWLMAGALLVDRFRSEAAHRRERERLVRATMAKHMPEFQALQRVIEGDAGAEQRAAAMRAVPEPDDWPKGAPRQPEGLTG